MPLDQWKLLPGGALDVATSASVHDLAVNTHMQREGALMSTYIRPLHFYQTAQNHLFGVGPSGTGAYYRFASQSLRAKVMSLEKFDADVAPVYKIL